MSREYMIIDKSGSSERIILFHVRDFIISAYEIDGLHPGFKEAMRLGVGVLENAKLLKEMTDEEGSNCSCGEAGDELGALLNLGDNLDDTADSMEVGEHSSQRIKDSFEKLRNIVGGDRMDPVDVLDEAIRYVKRLEMDLKNVKDM